MELSLLEMSKVEPRDNDRHTEIADINDDEKKQLEIAIMASLEDVSAPMPNSDGGAQRWIV